MRYILYSDIFQTLRKHKELRFVIFLKDNDLDYYRDKLGGENIIFEPVLFDKAYKMLRSNRLGSLFVLVRKCMSGSRKGYSNKTDTARLHEYKEHLSGNLKSKILFQVVRMLATTGSRISLFRKMILSTEGFLFPGRMYDHYFKKYKPQMLIISSIGYMIDPYFMRAAKRNHCKIVSIVHNWDNTSNKDYRGADPDVVIAWNSLMKREVDIFHDVHEEKIWVGGIAHWDFYFNNSFRPRSKEDFLESYDFSPRKQTIFYGTSSPVAFRNTFDVIEQLMERTETDPGLSGIQVLVRLHPTYMNRQRGKEALVVEKYREKMGLFKDKYGNRIAFNLPKITILNDDVDMTQEDMYTLAEILTYSDIMLTEYSTLMIEGSIFDIPVINVGLYYYMNTKKPASYFEERTHIRRITETGATKNAYTIEQLCEYIKLYLEDPSRDRDLRTKLVDQEVDTNRGHAGEQIADYVFDLLYEKT